MRRRAFIAALGGAAAWPVVARGQQPGKTPRIGVLFPGTPASYSTRARAFLEGLQEHGYVEGRSLRLSGDGGGARQTDCPNSLRTRGTQCKRGREGRNTGWKGAQKRDANHSDCHGSHRRSGRCGIVEKVFRIQAEIDSIHHRCNGA